MSGENMQLLERQAMPAPFPTLFALARPILAGLARPFTKDYWFAPGCRRSYQLSRYTIGLLYLYLANLWLGYLTPKLDLDLLLQWLNPEMYRPLGVMGLFGQSPPPRVFYEICLLLLRICPITLLLGFFSRLSLLGCICGLFGLSILQYGYSLQWSHGFSPILVTSLAFLLGPRHHDGFDGWLRRRLGKTWSDSDDQRARAAVLSVQLMVSLVFLNAAFYKCYAYGEGLHHFFPWVLSDNLRNIIIRQHVLFDVPIEEPFRYIVTHAFAYKGMALGNMVAQTMPFLALFLMNRPWLRLLCGVPLVMEVLGLGFIMGIWNIHWLLFIAFFVDWDRLAFRTRSPLAPREAGATSYIAESDLQSRCAAPRRPLAEREGYEHASRVTQGTPPKHAVLVHSLSLVLLLGFNGYVMFQHVGQHAWTFPFTSYPMFSEVVAEKPFDEHLPFYIPVSGFEFDTDKQVDPEWVHGNWMINWGTMWIPDTRQVNKMIIVGLEMSHACRVREMKAYRAFRRIEKYPSCAVREMNKYLVYHYRDGQVETVTSSVKHDPEKKSNYIDFQPIGLQSPRVGLKFVSEEGEQPQPLAGQLLNDRFYYTRPTAKKVMVIFEVSEPDRPPVLFAGPLL
jgi:hypothetical protein